MAKTSWGASDTLGFCEGAHGPLPMWTDCAGPVDQMGHGVIRATKVNADEAKICVLGNHKKYTKTG